MIRLVPYLFYLILLAAHQVVIRDLTAVGSASINLVALILGLVSLYKSESTVMWFGFFGGLMVSAGNPSAVGWHALSLALIGLVAVELRARLNLDSLMAKLLLIAAVVLIHNIASLVIAQTGNLFWELLLVCLPGTLYTVSIGWVFFQIKEKRITTEKIKANF